MDNDCDGRTPTVQEEKPIIKTKDKNKIIRFFITQI